MIKLVVFDWNGTLLADTLACMEADNQVLKTFGGTPVTLNEFRKTIIIPSIDFYVQHGCDRNTLLEKADKVSELFHATYESRASKCRTRTGTKELLPYLSSKSIDAVILSNHTMDGIHSQLARLNISMYFKDVLANSGLDSSLTGRNKSEKLQAYLQNSSYQPNETMIVGDSPEEIEIAHSLNLISVAVTGGYYSTQRLRNVKPDYLIGNIAKLTDIINN